MRLNFNPLGLQKPEIEKISCKGFDRSLYFKKVGFISPNDSPIPYDVLIDIQAGLEYFKSLACDRLMIEESVDEETAMRMLEGYKEGDSDVLPTRKVQKYLSLEEYTQYQRIMAQFVPRYKVATIFLANRYAYDVEVVEAAKASDGAVVLKVQPLKFSIHADERIRFGDTVVDLAGSAVADSDQIILKSCPINLPTGSIGFVLSVETQNYKFGLPGWKEEDTKNLPEPLITEIQAFYLRENKMFTPDEDTEKKEPEGKEPEAESKGFRKAKAKLEASVTTGLSAGSESNPTESETLDLNSKTLETCPVS